VKIQRFEEGLDWLPASIETQIDTAILQGPTAVSAFAALHDGLGGGTAGLHTPFDTSSRQQGMRDIPVFLRYLPSQGREGLYEALRDPESPFNTFSPDEYRSAALRATFSLIELGGGVFQAEHQSGWPSEAKVWGRSNPFGTTLSPNADAERFFRQMAFHLSGRFGFPAREQKQTGAPDRQTR
jgi:hypothetical protein